MKGAGEKRNLLCERRFKGTLKVFKSVCLKRMLERG